MTWSWSWLAADVVLACFAIFVEAAANAFDLDGDGEPIE